MSVPAIVCVGGSSMDHDKGSCLNSIELFDLVQNKWRLATGGTHLRNALKKMGVACAGEKMFVVGGYDGHNILNAVECFDFLSGRWTKLAPLPTARCGHALVALDEKYLYAIGGWVNGIRTNLVERYEISRNEWAEVAPMSVRRGGVAAAVYDGKMYVVGGQKSYYMNLYSAECYDPAANMWTSIAPMIHKRFNFGVAVVRRNLYAIGGHSSDGCCERYSFAEKKWTTIKPLLKIRGGLSVASIGRRIFAIGDGGVVEVFDTEKGEWAHSASLNEQRCWHGVASLIRHSSVLSGLKREENGITPHLPATRIGHNLTHPPPSSSSPAIEVWTLDESSDEDDAPSWVVAKKAKMEVKQELVEQSGTVAVSFVAEQERRYSITLKKSSAIEGTAKGQTGIKQNTSREQQKKLTPAASPNYEQIASAKANVKFCPKCNEPVRLVLDDCFCPYCFFDVTGYVEKFVGGGDEAEQQKGPTPARTIASTSNPQTVLQSKVSAMAKSMLQFCPACGAPFRLFSSTVRFCVRCSFNVVDYFEHLAKASDGH